MVAVFVAGAALGCGGGAPVEPNEAAIIPEWARASEIVVDVDLLQRTVSVVSGSGVIGSAGSANGAASAVEVSGVSLVASDYSATGLGMGGAPAGKVRVRFGLAVANQRTDLLLDTPVGLATPAGQQGVLVFPYTATAVNAPGGVGVSANGDVVIDAPSTGAVVASMDFDGDGRAGAGAPFPFFASVSCPAQRPSGACFRYETFAPVAGAVTSAARTVGFDVDPTVRAFRVRLLVAANAIRRAAAE